MLSKFASRGPFTILTFAICILSQLRLDQTIPNVWGHEGTAKVLVVPIFKMKVKAEFSETVQIAAIYHCAYFDKVIAHKINIIFKSRLMDRSYDSFKGSFHALSIPRSNVIAHSSKIDAPVITSLCLDYFIFSLVYFIKVVDA